MNNQNLSNNRYMRYLFIFFGTFFLGVGIIGIVVPILPTTPFLLLTAACYARGSKRFYHWLLHNKWFGTYIKNYQEGKGVPIKFKVYTICLLWVTILFSVIFLLENIWFKLMLLIIALSVSFHIITIKTMKIQ